MKLSRIGLAVLAIGVVVGVAACSQDEGPSQSEVQAQRAAEQAAVAAEAAQEQVQQLEKQLEEQEQANKSSSGEDANPPASSEPPNVVGLTLPAANKLLRNAGYKSDPRNTDTTFGILIPENFTVCKQDAPRGNIVPLLAQKYGC